MSYYFNDGHSNVSLAGQYYNSNSRAYQGSSSSYSQHVSGSSHPSNYPQQVASHRHTQYQPVKHAASPSARSYHAPTQIDNRPPDHWHSTKHLLSINFGSKEEYPYTISFKPPPGGPCKYGVAMLNLENGRGMLDPDRHVDECLPPQLARYPNASFLIDWPGYRQQSYVLTLIDPRTGRHVTRAQLGAQATQIFKDFANTRKEEDFFEGQGIFLGIDGVVYDQVRLSELYTKDGITFRAQFGLNAHYLNVDE